MTEMLETAYVIRRRLVEPHEEMFAALRVHIFVQWQARSR
jgi:hypothetical protein